MLISMCRAGRPSERGYRGEVSYEELVLAARDVSISNELPTRPESVLETLKTYVGSSTGFLILGIVGVLHRSNLHLHVLYLFILIFLC